MSRPSHTSVNLRLCAPNRRSLYLAPEFDGLAIRGKIHEIRAASAGPFRNFGLWLSLVERLVRDQEAVGSNPTSPMLINLEVVEPVAAAIGHGFKSHKPD